MTNRKVLHVSAVDFTASKLLRPQLVHLGEAGYDVRVTCGRTEQSHWDVLAPFEPVDLAFPRNLRPFDMLRASLRLRELVRSWRPDILHLHTPAASIPVRALPSWMWPKEMRVIYTVHGYLHQWPPAGARERLVQNVERWEARRCALTFFQSAEDFEAASRLGYRGRPTLLGNGVEDGWFELPPPARDASRDLAVLFVGRLVREKGILDLLEALQDVPGVFLHVAGDALPSDRDSVATEVRSLAEGPLQGRVKLHGMLTKQDLQQLYAEVDAMCLPSYREGVPRSVIEALAAARPVLASRIRGNRELVRHGQNGLLFEAGDRLSLCAALMELRDTPAGSFASMSRAARSSMDPDFREQQVFARLIAGYRLALEA